ncbi:MAG TPA: hypothetical protein VKE92_04520, partial [Anaerolineales bacterium]|nr:hypothetical protein [Anaerolineales bacterium]
MRDQEERFIDYMTYRHALWKIIAGTDMSNLLLKSDLTVTLDPDDRILKEGYIIVEDDSIVEMGLQKDLDSRRKFDDVLELKNRLVMPGLINAHTHSP